MAQMLNLHVQYWQECEICEYDSSLDQYEAEDWEPTECPNCNKENNEKD